MHGIVTQQSQQYATFITCDIKFRNKVSLCVILKGVYMLPFFLRKSRVPKMITMVSRIAITPAIPPITAYSPLEDVSCITENKQEK